jgi:hypothetical protein
MDPVRLEVTPRDGTWVEVSALRQAVKKAGFKPEEIRYTLTGRLTEWRGRPALAVTGSDRLVVLEPEPAPSPAEPPRPKQIAVGAGKRVEIEARWTDRTAATDPGAPAVLSVRRLEYTD